jgi:hypothetical protein
MSISAPFPKVHHQQLLEIEIAVILRLSGDDGVASRTATVQSMREEPVNREQHLRRWQLYDFCHFEHVLLQQQPLRMTKRPQLRLYLTQTE